MTQAFAYARWSPRPNAETCDSAEKQQDRIAGYCRAHAYDLAGTFEDREMSGGRADNRPGLQAAIEAACAAQGVLIAYKLDRLARNTRELLEIYERLEKSGAWFATILDHMNTRGPMGKMMVTVLGAFATMERDLSRIRTKTAMLHHQANGRRMTRPDQCRFGQQLDPTDPKKVIACPEETAILAQIAALRAEGAGYRKIKTWLEARGLLCRGNPWQISTIRVISKRLQQVVDS